MIRTVLSTVVVAVVIGADPAAAQTPAPAEPQASPADLAPTAIAYRSYVAAVGGGEPLEGIEERDLIDRTVTTSEGETVGTVTDLAMGPGDETRHVVVDVRGFVRDSRIASPLPKGPERFVVVAIDTLAGEGDALVLSKSRSEVESMTFYEQRDGLWLPATTAT
jgi:sporulation protein YlmC with PRC-barrel domain